MRLICCVFGSCPLSKLGGKKKNQVCWREGAGERWERISNPAGLRPGHSPQMMCEESDSVYHCWHLTDPHNVLVHRKNNPGQQFSTLLHVWMLLSRYAIYSLQGPKIQLHHAPLCFVWHCHTLVLNWLKQCWKHQAAVSTQFWNCPVLQLCLPPLSETLCFSIWLFKAAIPNTQSRLIGQFTHVSLSTDANRPRQWRSGSENAIRIVNTGFWLLAIMS